MRKILLLICALLVISGCSSAGEKEGALKVGIVQFGDYPSLTQAAQGLKEALSHYDVIETNAHGQSDNLPLQLASLVDKEVDIIVALTTQGAQMAQNVLEGTSIPFIFLAVSDPVGAGLKDVSGVSDLAPIAQQMELVSELLPSVRKIGMVYRLSDANGVYQEKMYAQIAKDYNFELVSKGVLDIQELGLVLPDLVKDVDAMFLITDDLNVSATSLIVDESKKKGVPVFASEDGQFDQGVFASVSISYIDLGKQAAKMVENILIGDGLHEHQGPSSTSTVISQEIASELGIEVPLNLKAYVIK